jgi:enoyl-CoA hydratase
LSIIGEVRGGRAFRKKVWTWLLQLQLKKDKIMSTYRFTQFKIKNRVGWLILQRPEALNTLNSELLCELEERVEEISKLTLLECRALLLRGAGEKAFVAGADIKEMLDFIPEQAETFSRKGQSIFLSIENLPIPTVACVHGFALGGGLELAMACDLIWTSPEAKLGLPESKLGLVPGFGGTVRLPQKIGWPRALEWMISGKAFSAAEALAAGLVQWMAPEASSHEEFFNLCEKKAQEWFTQGPLAIKTLKSLKVGAGADLQALYIEEAKRFGKLFSFKDTREGLQAFVEKRIANFIGE